MSYRALYEFAQTVAAYQPQKQYVSRNALRDKCIELAGIPKLVHIRTGMNQGIARGVFLTPQNTDHPLVQQNGCHIVVTERELNQCWERFVYVKELTHLFDNPDARTASADQLDVLLGEFASLGELDTSSPQLDSERRAVWRALALFCSEERRRAFAAERRAVKIDDYGIALRLKIPKIHVPKLFSRTYEVFLEKEL